MRLYPKLNSTNIALLCIILGTFSCEKMEHQIEIQGHRGARGLMPENSIQGFLKAIDLGVDVLELDIVLSLDNQVVVSHEPWFNPEIMSLEDHITVEEAKTDYNIFQMNYAEIATFSFGEKPYDRFPKQEKLKAYKPLLTEVFEAVALHCKKKNLPIPRYNIEIKSDPRQVGLFYPSASHYVDTVVEVLKKYLAVDRYTLQSFDYMVLQKIHADYPQIKLSLLVEDGRSLSSQLNRLGFLPDIYSPGYRSLTLQKVNSLHEKGVLVIPWTVNEAAEMKRMISMGVDGLITDYPDLAIKTTTLYK